MNASCNYNYSGFARLRLFWALSRTPHGLLDMCTPAFAALLWLGHFPAWHVIGVGLMTAFAGYTAVYAFNDVLGYKSDKEKVQLGALRDDADCLDIDAIFIRYPLARGLLSLKEGLLWSIAWALVAVVGAYFLNPVCVLIFVAGCVLEAVYCFMWKVSPLRTVVSGFVKAAGAVAAVFAVDPSPSPVYLLVLSLMLFFWEIGGQNIPNDWVDLEEDKRLNARTIPTTLGVDRANLILQSTLVVTLLLNLAILNFAQLKFGIVFALLWLGTGVFLLFIPALRLSKIRDMTHAMILFNRSSYFPLALLLLVVVQLLLQTRAVHF